MRTEIVKNADDLSKIKIAWETLCEDLADSTSVFSSYHWYETWWRHFSAGAELSIIVMWEADRLIGVAPLMIRRATVHGLPVTAIGFIENRQSLHNDFVVRPSHRGKFLSQVLRTLDKVDTPWDIIIFRNLPDLSTNQVGLAATLDETRRDWRKSSTWYDSPYLVPCGTWEEYLAGRSSRARKSLRNIQNGMHKAGVVSVTQIRSREEFLGIKDAVFEVARKSWAESCGDSLASKANAEFSSDLALLAADQGWLSLWTLQLNGTMIAIEFHLRAFSKEHALRSHYLPEFAALSPGTYLEMQIIKHAFEETDRVTCYDFCGSFDSYKKKWTDRFAPHCDISVFSGGIYGRFLAVYERAIVPFLIRVFPQNFWSRSFFKRCGINTDRMSS